jgi:hypothetical protein
MNAPHLSNRQKLFFLAAGIGFIGFLILRGIRVDFKNTAELFNFIGIGLATVGAMLALWQVVLAINTANDTKEASLQSVLEGIRKESDDRDRHHDQRLADIQSQLASLSTQLELHQASLGHTGSLNQILAIKDQLSDVRAALAVSTRQGEIFLKLDRLEKELEQLKK